MKRMYTHALSWLTGASLFVIFAVVLVSSLSRYLFDAPLQWSEEIARYAMIFGAMFGTSLCYLEGRHIRFELVESFLSPSLRRLCVRITDLCVLTCGLVLTVAGYGLVTTRGDLLAPGSSLPMGVFQSAISLGGLCLAIAAVIQLVDARATTRQQSE
ncbi:TRAP transporter small permease [Marinobacter sp.]|uniref:TRAP transporter small permease n=1 Tax=Marinobacter sp. TaxID=50741 RepID=UPI0035C71A6B|nr:TRAP transporter small permease [Oleiphilaceae bacterium]